MGRLQARGNRSGSGSPVVNLPHRLHNSKDGKTRKDGNNTLQCLVATLFASADFFQIEEEGYVLFLSASVSVVSRF